MKVWPLEVIRAVYELHVSQRITEDWMRLGGVWVGDKMRHHFITVASAQHDVAVHPGDIRVVNTTQPTDTAAHTAMLRATWGPETRTVRLVGGVGDGRVLEVQDVLQTLHVYLPPPEPQVWGWGREVDVLPERDEQVYALSGWCEVDRIWLFGVLA